VYSTTSEQEVTIVAWLTLHTDVRPIGKAAAVVGLLVVLAFLVGIAVSGRAEYGGTPVEVRVLPLFGFVPPTLTVQRGAIVSWVNDDELPHTVTSTDGVFASQAIQSKESFLFRFDVPGTYGYFSGFQPHMMGRIVVR
jgi:plastocyanin